MTDRTHCLHGHPLTPENLLPRHDRGGRWRCKECQRISTARQREKRRTFRTPQHRVVAPDPSPYAPEEANRLHVNALRRLFGLEELA